MRLKVFSAPTVSAAMAEVRDALGDDAIIISTEETEDGVMVTAAVERVMAAPAREEAPAPPKVAKMGGEEDAVDQELLRRVVDFHRLPEKLSQDVLRTALSMDMGDGVFSLAGALDTILAFRPLEEAPEAPLMLVGPPGSGKSAALAKLATRSVLAGYDCLLISTDSARTGAAEQLAAFADRLKQPHATAETADDLAAILEEQAGDRVVYIDSLGINPYKAEERSIIRELMGKTDIEPVLVLPAGMDGEDAADMASALKSLGVRQLIGTRVDMGRRLGGLLAASYSAGLYFSDVTTSPYAGEGLDILNPVSLARLMVHCSGSKPKASNRRKASK